MRDRFGFTRMERDQFDYELDMSLYRQQHGLDDTDKVSRVVSSFVQDDMSSLEIGSKSLHDIEEGFVTERRAGKYVERRVRSHVS